jgi:glutamine synthetase
MGVEKAEAITSALAPTKLSYKRLTVESVLSYPLARLTAH